MSTQTMSLTLLTAIAFSPAALDAADDSRMIVRVYPVGNLVRSVPDYPYRPGLPTTDTRQPSAPGSSGGTAALGQPLGGGGFGGGGAGGGGFFQIGNVPPGMVAGFGGQNKSSSNMAIDIRELTGVIQSTIAPMTWTNSGGDGTIVSIGHSLVVRQTEEVLGEIDALIQALSRQSDNQTMLTVQAYLLTLQPGEETENWEKKAAAAKSDQSATNQLLSELRSAATPVGQITCFSGQEVYLASGEVRNVITSLVPVVSAVAVGYQPQIAYPHIGTLLELETTVDAGETDAATMDVRCTITAWQDGGEPIRFESEYAPGKASGVSEEGKGGRIEAAIDRVNIETQQLATTVRVPVTRENKPPIPFIVGSISSPAQPDANGKEKAGLTHLVVIVTRP